MNNVNILIPMAGNGSRFAEKGYLLPKPIIEVFGKPMVSWVTSNFANIPNNKFIFICRQEHQNNFDIENKIHDLVHDSTVVFVDHLTEGAACTTLLAKDFINNDSPLIIANSDQYVLWKEDEFYRFCQDDLDAAILTFPSQEAKWSYAKLDENQFVVEVAEKKVISKEATVGIYFWKKGSDYVKYAEQMIEKNIRVKNEFYVCPVFNEAIQDGKKVKTFQIDKEAMWGLGTPEDLEYFLQNFKGGK